MIFFTAILIHTGFGEALHVVFLNPSTPDFWFWKMETEFMEAAADDLEIHLEVVYSRWNHLQTIRQAREIANRKNPPDVILTGNEKRTAGPVIEIAQDSEIDVFLFSNGFVESNDLEKYDKPRKVYSHWIGQYIPDNYSAGYLIGDKLISEGLRQNLTDEQGRLNIIAFAGANATHASAERVRGLNDAVSAYGELVRVLQIFPGDWTSETAAERSFGMFNRYRDRNIGAIWSANDSMAFGVMGTARSLGYQPGKDFLIGSCGWDSEAFEQVKKEELLTTVGGHFMDGAWSLIMLFDYYNGFDFIEESDTSEMHVIDRSNVDLFIEHLGKQEWDKIDFREFSKEFNPHISEYDFSLEALLRQFE